MDLKLVRSEFRPDGIFGVLSDQTGKKIAVTLEHAYPNLDTWAPKLPDGVYNCARGMHELDSMKAPFEAFEILNVPGHTGILFHIGNYNSDSEGCVLLGTYFSQDGAVQIIAASHIAFLEFMNLQQGANQFSVEVSSLS